MQKRFFPASLLLALFLAVFAFIGVKTHQSQQVSAFAEQKRVYLTFDDGPSTVVTNQILDTLKTENVKATFFIVSDRAQTRKDTLKRIAAEGHTLGVHSASHDYSKIYASDAALLRDVDECAKFIQQTTGVTPSVYRFPGGGAKNKQRQTALLEGKGYKVIGWNAVNGDEEIFHASEDTLVQQTIKTSGNQSTVILLMHDSAHHKATAQSLPRVIAYYREQGYSFCAF